MFLLMTLRVFSQTNECDCGDISKQQVTKGFFLKSFRLDCNNPENTKIVLNKGAIYEFLILSPNPQLTVTLLNKGTVIGSNFKKGEYQTGFNFQCQKSGLYSIEVKNFSNTKITGCVSLNFIGKQNTSELNKDYPLLPSSKAIEENITENKILDDNIPPQISITYPNVSRGFKPVEQQNQVKITGKATDESGIFEILINNEPASVDAQGNFSKTVLLAFGDNSFTVKATDLKQNSTTETFIIERKSNQQDVVVVNNQTNNSGNLQTGKYYALIIGNNSYQDPAISSLDEPINDATKLYNVLTTEYTFEPQNVIFLKNASYVQMIEAFDNLSSKITPNDNLLVFYAGHGWWDETKNLGYWLPCDAKKSNTAFWIANSRISDYMSSINSKHTLLIADACFSGSIFKTRSAFVDAQPAINKLYELPSKKAMTSGNLKEVPDKSVFLQFLVKRLEDNKEKYISSDMLFASFRQAVLNNSPTEPQYGTIQNAGDEGGEFIFIRK